MVVSLANRLDDPKWLLLDLVALFFLLISGIAFAVEMKDGFGFFDLIIALSFLTLWHKWGTTLIEQ